MVRYVERFSEENYIKSQALTGAWTQCCNTSHEKFQHFTQDSTRPRQQNVCGHKRTQSHTGIHRHTQTRTYISIIYGLHMHTRMHDTWAHTWITALCQQKKDHGRGEDVRRNEGEKRRNLPPQEGGRRVEV